MNNNPLLKRSIIILLAIALIGPWSIDLGPIPLTLQTFAIFIGASLLPWPWAVAVILAYLGLGAIGLPVFGHHTSGWERLFGTTAGFLWGFVLSGAYVSYAAQKQDFHFFGAMLTFLRAHLILLIPGYLVIYLLHPEAGIWSSLVHLIPGLILKSILGGIIASQIRAKLVSDS